MTQMVWIFICGSFCQVRLEWHRHCTLQSVFNPNSTCYIRCRIDNPNPIPRKVAMEIPKMPARTPGTVKELHPLVLAIPQAVVGPPILALEAISSVFRSNPRSLPTPSMRTKCTVSWTKANAKMLGVVLMTFEMLPFAPTTVKKTLYLHKC